MISPQQKRIWLGLMLTMNLHSLTQPPKEVCAVACRDPIWELSEFEITWGT